MPKVSAMNCEPSQINEFGPFKGRLQGRVLNLGSGNFYVNGWNNADLYNDHVDIRFDMKLDWPILSNSYDAI